MSKLIRGKRLTGSSDRFGSRRSGRGLTYETLEARNMLTAISESFNVATGTLTFEAGDSGQSLSLVVQTDPNGSTFDVSYSGDVASPASQSGVTAIQFLGDSDSDTFHFSLSDDFSSNQSPSLTIASGQVLVMSGNAALAVDYGSVATLDVNNQFGSIYVASAPMASLTTAGATTIVVADLGESSASLGTTPIGTPSGVGSTAAGDSGGSTTGSSLTFVGTATASSLISEAVITTPSGDALDLTAPRLYVYGSAAATAFLSEPQPQLGQTNVYPAPPAIPNVAAITPAYTSFSGAGGTGFAAGFGRVYVTSRSEIDESYFYSALGATYVATSNYSYLSSGSTTVFAEGFYNVYAYSAGDGSDSAFFYDSTGATFVGGASYSYMTIQGGSAGVNTFIDAVGFAKVNAIASGPAASAFLYDAAGANIFFAAGTDGTLVAANAGTSVSVSGFSAVTPEDVNGSDDTAYVQAVDYALSFVGPWVREPVSFN